MERYFNTSGPCEPELHYMLPPERRLGRVRELIEQERFFTLHAGRQTGKTTSARWVVDELNREGRFVASWVDLQPAGRKAEPAPTMAAVLLALRLALASDLPGLRLPAPADDQALLEVPDFALLRFLRAVARESAKPLVLLLDEADGLLGAAMVSFLTQLRSGYVNRSRMPFLWSVALVGQRRVRDYALTREEMRDLAWLGTTSPFNVEAEALTLAPFTRDEVGELLGQHTRATGQRFEPDAVELVYELSQGHPWLANALAYEAAFRDVKDRSVAITAQHVETGRARIVRERRTHIDSLAARLTEPRVRRIVAPMIAGDVSEPLSDADRDYVVDLGLLKRDPKLGLVPANPIYREIILRALSSGASDSMYLPKTFWLHPDGTLDPQGLLQGFLSFWRLHGGPLMRTVEYHEIAAHLVLMAFLHRVENGGGRLEREYSIGSGRLDLCLRHGATTLAIEVKVWSERDPLARGLDQLDEYLAGLGPEALAWLVIFDRRPGQPPVEDRTSASAVRTPAGREVVVVRA